MKKSRYSYHGGSTIIGPESGLMAGSKPTSPDDLADVRAENMRRHTQSLERMLGGKYKGKRKG